MPEDGPKLCARCGVRRVAYHINHGSTGESVDLCEACYEIVEPKAGSAQRREEARLKRMLDRGRCRFCGGSAAGGGIFPSGTASREHPETYLWCPTCMEYAEEFKATPEGHIREEVPMNLDDETAWRAIAKRNRHWFELCEAFIRKRLSERSS